jgi:hypothetical protein
MMEAFTSTWHFIRDRIWFLRPKPPEVGDPIRPHKDTTWVVDPEGNVKTDKARRKVVMRAKR